MTHSTEQERRAHEKLPPLQKLTCNSCHEHAVGTSLDKQLYYRRQTSLAASPSMCTASRGECHNKNRSQNRRKHTGFEISASASSFSGRRGMDVINYLSAAPGDGPTASGASVVFSRTREHTKRAAPRRERHIRCSTLVLATRPTSNETPYREQGKPGASTMWRFHARNLHNFKVACSLRAHSRQMLPRCTHKSSMHASNREVARAACGARRSRASVS